MSEILNELSEMVYISNPKTFELYFVNDAAKKEFDLKKIPEHCKCYEILHNNTKPCINCKNYELVPNKVIEWDYTNPVTNKHYLIKDKLIKYPNNHEAHLAIISDVTKKISQDITINQTKLINDFIIKCIKILNDNNNFNNLIYNLLAGIGHFTKSERVFAFQMNNKNKTAKCMFEWTDINIPTLLLDNHEWNYYEISGIINKLKKNTTFLIENIEDYPDSKPEYHKFKNNGLQNTLIVPLFSKNLILEGFFGIENFTSSFSKEQIDFLLRTISVFIVSVMEQRIIRNKLEELSYKDSLTGLQNRNKYNSDLSTYENNKKMSIGIAFIDMNGLKKLNDSKGHSAGDESLKNIANVILKNVPLENTYRIGGDEFVIIIPKITEEDFNQIIQKIISCSGKDNIPSYSVGYQWYSKIMNLTKQLKETDLLMYEQKNNYYKLVRNLK